MIEQGIYYGHACQFLSCDFHADAAGRFIDPQGVSGVYAQDPNWTWVLLAVKNHWKYELGIRQGED